MFPPGIGHGPRYSNDHGGIAFNPNYKGRRPSVYQEKSWRSNTDHPQERIAVPHMKENLDPGRSFHDSDQKFALIGPPQHRDQFNTTYESKPGMIRPFQFERADSGNPRACSAYRRCTFLRMPPLHNLTTSHAKETGLVLAVLLSRSLSCSNVPLSIATKELKDMFFIVRISSRCQSWSAA